MDYIPTKQEMAWTLEHMKKDPDAVEFQEISHEEMIRTLANMKEEPETEEFQEVSNEGIRQNLMNIKREPEEESNYQADDWRWKCDFGPSCPVCGTLSDKEYELLISIKEPPKISGRPVRMKWRPYRRSRIFYPREAKMRGFWRVKYFRMS